MGIVHKIKLEFISGNFGFVRIRQNMMTEWISIIDCLAEYDKVFLTM